MNYQVTHTTSYHYSESVPVCHNLVILTPRSSQRSECVRHRLTIHPQPRYVIRRLDYFGNHVHGFSIEETHERLRVTSMSRVRVEPQPISSDMEATRRDAVSDWLDICPFLFDSPRVRRSSKFADYARPCFRPGASVLDAATALNAQIHRDITYDRDATEADTPVEEAFAIRKGVCQDMSHIFIAGVRSHGLPARYVSGYLRTYAPEGKTNLVGADQSHAWVSVHCGDLGWVEFDPTNGCLCGTDHIPMAWGRDYSDVVPIRGVFLGGGTHEIRVSVEVVALDA